MEIQYAIESLEATYEEIIPLAKKQWDELRFAPYEEEEFTPNLDGLFAMESVGSLLVITARSDDELVGYLILLCSELVNHAGVYQAAEHAMYVSKDHRRAGVAQAMVRHATVVCKTNGVTYLSFNVTPTLDYSPLLVAEGFGPTETVYTLKV